MRKYYTNWKGISTIFGVIFVGLIVSGYFEATSAEVFINASLGVGFLIGIVVLLSTVFSFASISGNTLKFVYLLLYRRKIDINSITEINDQPTYKVASSQFRSLYIFYKNKNADVKYIEFKITIFPESTLGKLVKDLKQINPSIKLNPYSERLMQSAQN